MTKGLEYITDKDDYALIISALTGEKTEFTASERDAILRVYMTKSMQKYGIDSEVMLKTILALDIPAINLLSDADNVALDVLKSICSTWSPDIDKINKAKDVALAGNASRAFIIALTKIAVDEYMEYLDDVHYQDLGGLMTILSETSENEFNDATIFIMRIRERTRKGVLDNE